MKLTVQHLDYLKRDYLDGLTHVQDPPETFFEKHGDSIRFFKVVGISNFWKNHPDKLSALNSLTSDIHAGLHGEKIPFVYLIIGEPSKVNIFVGSYGSYQFLDNTFSTVPASFQSAYPGIELQRELAPLDLNLLSSIKINSTFASLMVGTPTFKFSLDGNRIDQIERLIRGLYGTEPGCSQWAYIVTANPIQETDILQLYKSVLAELRSLADILKSGFIENSIAEKYKELLETFLEKLEIGNAQGLWHTAAIFLSEDSKVFNHGKAILKSVFSGEASRPDPIRVIQCYHPKVELHDLIHVTLPPPPAPGQVQYPFKYLSLLNSQELATLTSLPLEEMPGYFVKDYARFDVASHYHESKEKAISVGEVIDRGYQMGYSYKLALSNLDRHGLIVGTTGSGKTNTIFYLLKQIWQAGIPFLVIEPAKTEYRKLLYLEEFREILQVFTLGDEMTAPIRLNPFEIREGVSVQTHIDYLKSVFNSSFVMYAPMPYVLERCIHEIYEDKGWDLVTGENCQGLHFLAQPTLTDLYRKIEDVVSRLGYEEKITMDVKAALQTRINSLRIGSKGLMLDTPISTNISELLQKPTVMELEQIGDDDEKAFVIGLWLATLHEYYMAQGLQEGIELVHITVVEEAHRLFKRTPEIVDAETANIRGKAVETFCNILSEIRAYGEGCIIAEQIPSKLADDVIKNTNLKVMHRIVSGDDRGIMGNTMNLDDEQTQRIASLTVGEAAIYSEGDDKAILVKVPYNKVSSSTLSKLEERKLIQARRLDDKRLRERLVTCEVSNFFKGDIHTYVARAIRIVEEPEFQERLALCIISLVTCEFSILEELPKLIQYIYQFRKCNDTPDLIILVLQEGTYSYFKSHGKQYGWPYGNIEEISKIFLSISLKLFMKKLKTRGSEYILLGDQIVQLEEGELREICAFQKYYKTLCKLPCLPFLGCEKVCSNSTCLYRYNIEPLTRDKRLDESFNKALSEYSGDALWKQVKLVCQVVERRTASHNLSTEEKKKISLCFTILKSQKLPYFDAFLRENLVYKLAESY